MSDVDASPQNAKRESTPIADYAMLADCNSAMLVSRTGSIDWLCLPRYDSPAIFARLLGPDAGHWSIRPAGQFRSEHSYVPRRLALQTTFAADSGKAKGTDARAIAARHRGHRAGLSSPAAVPRL